MRNARAIIVLLLVSGLLAIVAPAPTTAGERKVLRVAHQQSVTNPFHLAAEKFAEGAAKRTNGMLEVQIFPGAQLGNQRELGEGVKIGTIDCIVLSPANLDFLNPQMAAFDLPYLFRNREHAFKVLDGDIGRPIFEKLLRDHGVRTLNAMESGFRHFTSNKPINSMADLKGMKVRATPNKSVLKTFQALGANPTVIAFPELFSALQQGVVQGQENPLSNIESAKLYEVQKYLALTYHIFSPVHIFMSEMVFKTLSPDYQRAILDAAKEAGTWERAYMVSQDGELLKRLKAVGMTVTEPKDLDKWAEAVQPVVKDFATEWGLPDWAEKVKSVK
jgi:tripartite ATP-independent transporter DctP family solute receptor